MQTGAGRAWMWAITGWIGGSAWMGAAFGQIPDTVPETLPTPPAQVAPYKPEPVAVVAPMPAPVAAPVDAPQAESGSRWDALPPVQKMQRPGYFSVLPTGPGHYSLFEALSGEEPRQGPHKYPYPRFSIKAFSTFDVDWRYLDKPDNTDFDYGDFLKRQKFLNDTVMFTTGGEIRYRVNNETNSRLLNVGPVALRGASNDYHLLRTRIYGDLYLGDSFRVFVEGIDARSYGQDLPPLPTDQNHADLLNAFVEVRTLEFANKPIWLRVGRQELCYGGQRVISPLDWVNTRRTFQGIKTFWQGEKWSVDAFCVQPVVPNTSRFDSVDNNQVFSGLWTTYRINKLQAVDLFVLNLDRAGAVAAGQGGVLGPSNVSTVGSRYLGQEGNWLWDLEGMFQAGTYSNQNLLAGTITTGGGYWFKDMPGTPTFWVNYDWASGDNSPGRTNTRSTFDQMFPFGHPYFGFTDVVGRRNIQDLNCELTFYPTKWITAQGQFHAFYLDSRVDALYNAGGAPIRRDPTGRAGSHVGNEVDLLVNIHLDNHADILISYSRLFAGSFIQKTATTAAGQKSLDYLYIQHSYRW